MRNVKPIELREKFSKGLAATKGDNQVPIQYASEIWNIRINDKWICPRNGFVEVYKWDTTWNSNWIWWIDSINKLFRVFDDKFQEIDVEDGTVTDIWDVIDTKCRFLIILH